MFDSGLGGLTVFKAIEKRLPFEKMIYFGDTARMPYGEKSAETILRYSIENAILLTDLNIKILVVACNTASSFSVDRLKKIFNLPVIGVIEPGAEKAVKTTKKGKIAILATKGTVQSLAYQNKIRSLDPSVEVTAIACPLLAQLVEEGMQNHPATELILKEYLAPLLEAKPDTILLGCTHYPAIKPLVEKLTDGKVEIIDSATTCAEKVAETLQKHALIKREDRGAHQFFVSDNPDKFQTLGSKFIAYPLPKVSLLKPF